MGKDSLAPGLCPKIVNLCLAFAPWKLATNYTRKEKGWRLASICCLCLNQEETRNHLFAECKIARWLWTVIHLKLGKQWKQMDNIQEIVRSLGDEFRGKGLCSTIAKLALSSNIYNLWKTRDEVIFNGTRFNWIQLIKDNDCFNWIQLIKDIEYDV